MGRMALKYFGGLIALYVVVYNGSNAGRVITSGAGGISTVARTLQGR